AFELFGTMEIDIILLDYMMQPLNGIEFTEMLRRADDSPNHKVPIIVVSAYCNRSIIEQARDAGVDEFIGKPVCATDLYMRITTVIENPRDYATSKSGFFGPDRRRRTGRANSGDGRRANDTEPATAETV
ncbi:MAG: response regulator, partial [Hyphomicrobiales bacterium]